MKKDEKKKKENEEITIKVSKKKLLQGLGIVLVVALVLGLAFLSSKNVGEGKTVEFNNITVDEYLELMQREDASIVYVARPTCSWCQKETPILKKVAGQYNLKVNYLNTEEFFDSSINDYTEEGKKFMSSSEKYAKGFGTPNTIIVGEGKIIDGEFGYVEASKLKELFQKNGFINE